MATTRRTLRVAKAGYRAMVKTTLDPAVDGEEMAQATAITAAIVEEVATQKDKSSTSGVAVRVAALPFVISVEVSDGREISGVLIENDEEKK